MNYKELIIEMLGNIENQNILIKIYSFIKALTE